MSELAFFDTQRREARNRTLWRFAYLLAIVAMIASISAYVVLIARLFGASGAQLALAFWLSGAMVTGLVVVASLLHPIARQRGFDIARGLGAQSLHVGSDLERAQLLNVSSEMAISAGLPRPRILVLEEETAINAFAIGRTPADSVIVITAGSFLHLKRDELQAMVAWCVARIRDGECAFDTELLRFNHGLMAPFSACVGMVKSLYQPAAEFSDAYGSVDARGGARALAVFSSLFLLMGALISAVGFVLARLLQAGATRRSILMSDGAVLQLTRAREPFLHLLLKLNDDYRQSRMHMALGEELTHLCFAPASWVPRLVLDSHPSAERRWRVFSSAAEVASLKLAPKRRVFTDAGLRAKHPKPSSPPVIAFAQSLLAAQLLESPAAEAQNKPVRTGVEFAPVPAPLQQICLDPCDARLLLMALFVCPPRIDRFRALAASLDDSQLTVQRTDRVWRELEGSLPSARLDLIALLWPTLADLPADERFRVLTSIQKEIFRDQRLELIECAQWCYLESLIRQSSHSLRAPRSHSVQQRSGDLRQLLNWMVRRSGARGSQMLELLQAHERAMGLSASSKMPLTEPEKLDQVVERLAHLNADAQKQCLRQLIEIASFDHALAVDEWLLLRCLAAAWDCPIAIPQEIASAAGKR